MTDCDCDVVLVAGCDGGPVLVLVLVLVLVSGVGWWVWRETEITFYSQFDAPTVFLSMLLGIDVSFRLRLSL